MAICFKITNKGITHIHVCPGVEISPFDNAFHLCIVINKDERRFPVIKKKNQNRIRVRETNYHNNQIAYMWNVQKYGGCEDSIFFYIYAHVNGS